MKHETKVLNKIYTYDTKRLKNLKHGNENIFAERSLSKEYTHSLFQQMVSWDTETKA